MHTLRPCCRLSTEIKKKTKNTFYLLNEEETMEEKQNAFVIYFIGSSGDSPLASLSSCNVCMHRIGFFRFFSSLCFCIIVRVNIVMVSLAGFVHPTIRHFNGKTIAMHV